MTEETGRSLFPERSIYEHQLERPQFSGLRRQAESLREAASTAQKGAQGHRHAPEPHPHQSGGDADLCGGVLLCGAAAHQFAGGGVLSLHAAVLRCVLRLRRADLRVSGQRGQGLLWLREEAVPHPHDNSRGAGGRGHRGWYRGLAGDPGRGLPGSADGGDRRLRHRGGGDQL